MKAAGVPMELELRTVCFKEGTKTDVHEGKNKAGEHQQQIQPASDHGWAYTSH